MVKSVASFIMATVRAKTACLSMDTVTASHHGNNRVFSMRRATEEEKREGGGERE